MLARVAPPTNDFAALARYLVHGRQRPTNPNRVAWILNQNLGTDDSELAAGFMQATAALSKRTRNAAYHLMIAWHERERPTPEMMQGIALKTLALAGLAEHQALIMGHGDKPHRHLHMMINRVHPGTGKAWKHNHDYARFDAIMRQLSDEYSFDYVPAHAFNPEPTDDLPKKPNSRATYAARRGANTRRTQWSKTASRALGAKLSECLDQAATWDDVETALADEGLTLEAKGHGLVVGTPAAYSKFSALGLTTSAKDFEKRFGSSFQRSQEEPSRPTRPVFSVDAVDIAKALAIWGLATKDDVHAAIDAAANERAQRLAQATLATQMLQQLNKLFRSKSSLTSPRSEQPRPYHVAKPARAKFGSKGR